MVQLIKSVTEFELSPTLKANQIVKALRAKGETVLHMGFGESPFPVPDRLQQALRKAAHRKEYLPTYGLPALCKAAKDYYQNRTGLDADKYDVIIAPGSKMIIYSLQMAIAGDLLMPVPSWVSYGPQSFMLHRDVVKVPTRLDDDGYHLDPDVLRRVIHEARKNGKDPRKLILNYPNNPTGLNIPEDLLKEIAAVCVEEDIFIIADEIYGFVSFNESYTSISKYAPTHTAITTGLSKHLSLGGWRVGIGFIPKAVDGLYELLSQIASETWSCVPSPIQQAVVTAYEGHEDIETFRRDSSSILNLLNTYVATNLREIGVICALPQGAFYNYPDFEPFRDKLAGIGIKTSKDLAQYLISQHSVMTLPGVAFGAAPETLTLRLSGCDYNGEEILEAYQNGAPLDDDFIAAYAPRVKAAMAEFTKFVAYIDNRKQKAAE